MIQQDIGIDVEDMQRREVSTTIADRFFSPIEVHDFNKMPVVERRKRFFDYWTLKESYIKARGMGLSIPLEQFSFHISEGDSIGVSFDPKLEDDPRRWQFWLLGPTKRHKSAISVSVDPAAVIEYGLIARKTIPLVEEQDFKCPIMKKSNPD